MKRQSADNKLQSEERVINIVVIKDPSGWDEGSTVALSSSQGHRQSFDQQVPGNSEKRVNVAPHPHFYKSQSFTVGTRPDGPMLPCRGFDYHHSSHGNNFTPSTFTNPSFPSTSVHHSSAFGPSQSTPRREVSTEDTYNGYVQRNGNKLPLFQRENPQGSVSAFQTKSTDANKTRLLRHRSVPLPLEGNMAALDTNFFNNSTTSHSPIVASPSVFSSNDGQDTFFNSPVGVATTPDSGFCTPSLLSAPFQALLNSTPTVASGCPNVNSNEVKIDPLFAGEKSPDSIFNNSLEWNDDDSAVDEEGGDSPLNSSLRSVNWLKTFPIGDSVVNISPPMPCSSPSYNSASHHYQDIQKPSSMKQVQESFVSSVPDEIKLQAKPMPHSSSSQFTSISAPFPIFMPAVTQDKPVMASTRDHGILASQSHKPAFGELEVNKKKKPTKRKKVKGHFFTRPDYSYADLIKLAIKSSESGKMTLREITTWIEDHFPFFKHEAKSNWKSTLKQSLSQRADFKKVDEKPKTKWSVPDATSYEHLKAVMKPPEIPSHVLESLNKSKRNVPQPILPKLNAYALVPIQSLAVDASTPACSIGTPVQARPTSALPFSQCQQQQQQQKLIHILPNTQPPQCHSAPSSSHQVPQKRARLARGRRPRSSTLDPRLGACAMGRNLEGVTPNSSIPSQKTTAVSVNNQGCKNEHLSNLLQPDLVGSRCHIGMNDLRNQQGKKVRLPKQQNFPLDSVVDIQEEVGSRPGEKKIIFVLKDDHESEPVSNQSAQNLQQKPQVHVKQDGSSEPKRSCNQTHCMPKVTKTVVDNAKAGSKRKIGLQRKSGPVMNLRHVLENYHEDKTAAETIGRILSEEDRQASDAYTKSDLTADRGQFTQLKSYSKQSHLIAQQHVDAFKTSHAPENSNIQSKDAKSQRKMEKGNCKTKSLPVVSKKTNIMERANIMKGKRTFVKSSSAPDRSSACADIYSHSIEKDANLVSSGKLTVPNTSSDNQHFTACSRGAIKSSATTYSQKIPRLETLCGDTHVPDIPRPTLYRTKSRRKQVHVPLKSGISPDRNDFLQNISKLDKKSVTTPLTAHSSSLATGPHHFLGSLSPKCLLDDHNNSANGFSSSSSDLENAPSLHFLSTFTKTPDSSNKENIADPGHHISQLSVPVKALSSNGTGQSGKLTNSTLHSSHLGSFNSASPSMTTPPCGNLRLTSSTLTTATGTFTNNLLSLAPTVSPSASPKTLQQLNLHLPSTPPPAMAPLSMSTPTRSSSQAFPTSRVVTDVFDISPLPGNVTGMLDTSFLDHLETLMADLHPQQLSSGNNVPSSFCS